MFGEVVLGYIKTSTKAAPRWTKGIWVGKTLPNDGHIIIHAEGVFVTTSVRRLPIPFVLEPLGEITTSPWDHGYASLGHRMLYTGNVSPPFAVSMPMTDVDAEHVKTYAAKHVGSDSDRLRWGMKLVKLKLQTRLIQPLTVGPWMHLDLQHLKNVEWQTALFCLVAPKSSVLEMTSQQHRGTTPWILQ